MRHSENNGPNGTGHLNVINSSEYLNAMTPGVDLPYLYKWLKTVPPNGDGPVVASFNHPGAHGYNNWAWCDPQVADVITLLEVINSNNKVHYEAFVNALDKGWKVSPVCGLDNHGFWGITHHTSRTLVLATAKTKAAILDAMKHRRTYASLDGNIQCRYTVNGAIMGSTLNRPDVFQFNISISDPDTNKPKDKITKLDIVKDGGAVVADLQSRRPRIPSTGTQRSRTPPTGISSCGCGMRGAAMRPAAARPSPSPGWRRSGRADEAAHADCRSRRSGAQTFLAAGGEWYRQSCPESTCS